MVGSVLWKDISSLMYYAKKLEGITLNSIQPQMQDSDEQSRVITKGNVGYVIEHDYFGVKKNSDAAPDLPELGVEIKSCPLKFNKNRTRLSVKEPLSLNIINYEDEVKNQSLKDSSIYKKNKKILFIFYIHDKSIVRSRYIIKYVFLWEMTDKVLEELEPDYQKILTKIREGKAHEIHQTQHLYLTLCPKHNGKFKDPNDKISKRKQPFSDVPAETRAFRLKNRYVNQIICQSIGKELGKGGWLVN